MVYVQDIDGKPMMPTTRHGKVRRLLKDSKAVVVNTCPFTIKLMYKTSDYKQEIDPRNRDIHGVVVGYSNDFNSLVAVCDEGSKKGVDKGSTDFVDVNERYVTNGFFYISVEDADKQSNYMGGNS